MATFTFEELLKPFEYLDISSLYNNYSFIIDAIIAFLIFFGVAKVTLGKRFEGRGGKAIIIGISSNPGITVVVVVIVTTTL